MKFLLFEKNKQGAFYLIYDDIYFEKIDNDTIITRDVYTIARKILKPLGVIKYLSFNVDKSYTTEQIYELINILRKDTTIIVTIFNPIENEVFLLFISNKDDSMLEKYIKEFLEVM